MATPNTYLEGINARPASAAQARTLIGRRIEYLRRSDIDHSGRGYYFPRFDKVVEVHGRNIRMEDADWMLFTDLVEVRIIEESVEQTPQR